MKWFSQEPQPGLEPRLLDPQSNAETIQVTDASQLSQSILIEPKEPG